MKILFDGRYILTNDYDVLPAGGIGRYCYNLLLSLLRLETNLELTILVPAGNRRALFPSLSSSVKEIPCGYRANSMHTQFLLTRLIDTRPYDIFHSPFNMLPRGLECRSVVTIHDIMWLTRPELCAGFWPERLAVGLLYRLGMGYAMRHADRIIAISRTAGAAISEYLSSGSERIDVVHHGIEPFFQRLSPEEAYLRWQPLPAPPKTFILAVGQGSPYKNHVRAVRAFLQACAARPEVQLVLVRRFHRFDREMRHLLREPAVRDRVILYPAVSDAQLRALYQLAHIFLFPSLEEGFGLPVLEAMACGTPVIAGDIGVMREISGDAALLVNPESIDAIAAGLSQVMNDAALRGRLVARGLHRARQFSWQRCAERTLACYEHVLRGR